MSSITPAQTQSPAREPFTPTVLRWREWPLVDRGRWSCAVLLGLLVVGAGVGYVSTNWMLGVAAGVALAATLWQFLLPAQYELNSVGFSRQVLGHRRLVPWQAVRAYQLRSTGVVLFQFDDPTPIDALRSEFLPYAGDEDETLCTVRHYLPHAVELPA
jgi:hypothetical protein